MNIIWSPKLKGIAEFIVDVGAKWSEDCAASTKSDWIVPGWTPMSANRLIIACWASREVLGPSRLWLQKTVPAEKTSAPLAAR
jgi:hypothetical protein